MKKAEELRAQADKLWNESISQIKSDSLFVKQGLAKIQALYDKANRLETIK